MQFLKNLNVGVKIWTIVLTLFVALAGMIGYTYLGLKGQQADSGVINDAGRQRMFTQKMSKLAQSVNQGNLGKSEKLRGVMSDFDEVLTGLIEGDSERNYPPAPTEAIKTKLTETKRSWTPFKKNLEKFLDAGPAVVRALRFLKDNNSKLFDRAQTLVTALQNENGTSQQINLSGKLRALSQKITKAALLYNRGIEGSREELKNSIDTFDQIVLGLSGQSSDADVSGVRGELSRQALSDLKTLWSEFKGEARTVQKQAGTKNQALAYVMDNNNSLLSQMNEGVSAWANHSRGKVFAMIRTELILAVLIFLVAGALSWLIVRQISIPLVEVSKRLRKMADGDLTQDRSEYVAEDEIGTIAAAYNELLENMNNFVGSVKDSVAQARSVSDEVDKAAEELNRASQELSEGAEEQSSSLQETSSSVEEMASMISQSATNAEECDELSDEARRITQNGAEKIDELTRTVEKIDEDSEEIAEAIEVIDDIAFQTNLLALNAAVEAANAGEHGEGFAVVADEVRELAQRSAEAADEIGDIIENSTERTSRGAKLAQESREALSEIEEGVGEVSERMQEIADATDQQSRGIEEINKAVTELETVTEQNTSNARETASSSDELASQANSLRELVVDLNDQVGAYRIENGGGGSIEPSASVAPSGQSVVEESENGDHTNGESDAEGVIPLEEDQAGF